MDSEEDDPEDREMDVEDVAAGEEDPAEAFEEVHPLFACTPANN